MFDLSLAETADVLQTSVGAVKSALGRARGRLDGRKPRAGLDAPPVEVVRRFTNAQIFVHAHIVMPRLGLGAHPRWEVADYEGEAVALGSGHSMAWRG